VRRTAMVVTNATAAAAAEPVNFSVLMPLMGKLVNGSVVNTPVDIASTGA